MKLLPLCRKRSELLSWKRNSSDGPLQELRDYLLLLHYITSFGINRTITNQRIKQKKILAAEI
jgi:hypothetical protein